VSGETIRLSTSLTLAVDFFHVTYIKDKTAAGISFVFVLLWTGRCSSLSSVLLWGSVS